MEIEVKYRIPNVQTAESLKTIPVLGAYSLSPGYFVSMHDTYYDTEDASLFAAGYALRERHYPDTVCISLKSLSPPIDNLHIREEHEIHSADLKIAACDTWDKTPLFDQVWCMTNGQDVQPICELHQDRFTRGISRDSIEVANFCVDEVTYGHPDMQRIYLCLEMELTESGKDTDLANLRKLLEQKYHLIPDRMSKFELVLAFTQVPRPLLENNGKSETSAPPINPDDTMATATIKTFQYHFDKMKRNDAGAHQGEDIDYIHDMRVAVRRMRTANRVFADYISANKMKPYGKVLKQTGRVLGVIRDMDVFRENFEGYASEQRIDTRRSTLTAIWNAAYSQARTQLSQYLASESYLDFRNTFDKRVHTVVINTPTTPKVADQMWLILSTQQQQFVSYYQQLSHNPPFPLLGYHQLRIYLKHFRYTIEYFRHILVDKGEETITKTKVVQDHLGALQDAVVASKQLKTVLQWGMWHPPTQPYTLMPHTHQPTADVPAYLNYTESRIDQLITGFPRVWQIYTDFLAKGVLSN